jgi:hypothetical protein
VRRAGAGVADVQLEAEGRSGREVHRGERVEGYRPEFRVVEAAAAAGHTSDLARTQQRPVHVRLGPQVESDADGVAVLQSYPHLCRAERRQLVRRRLAVVEDVELVGALRRHVDPSSARVGGEHDGLLSDPDGFDDGVRDAVDDGEGVLVLVGDVDPVRERVDRDAGRFVPDGYRGDNRVGGGIDHRHVVVVAVGDVGAVRHRVDIDAGLSARFTSFRWCKTSRSHR